MKESKFKRALLMGVAAAAVAMPAAADKVEVVDRPLQGNQSNYPAFRVPLQEAPLLKLPVGKIKPKGWLRVYLERQRDGLNGQLGTISAWLDKNNNQWLSGAGDHGWEEVPYWLRGYASLAYILDDTKMKEEAQVWFEGVYANARPDGCFGPGTTERDALWAKMPVLWALQSNYEATGDRRVLDLMTNYFKWELSVPDSEFLNNYWENKRGGDNIWSVLWLYNRTGDESILPLIDKLHRNGCDWTMKGDLPNYHGVNIAQGFREPAMYYMYSKEPEMLRAAYDNQDEIRRRYGQVPGGMYAADENARKGYVDPRQAAETCAFVEQMASDEILMGITGDPYWADHCENVAFNSFTASMTPDMKALRYLTSPNMTVADEKLHGPSIDNNIPGMLSMSPFSSRCCQHNHGFGWPYYAEHLVMATTDGGLATMLYAEHETTAMVADGKEVTISATTHYPFDEKVTIAVATPSAVSFPLYLRIPAWAEGASVKVNGKKVAAADAEGKYVRVDRKWKNGDRVELTFPMAVKSTVWEQNKNSVSVDYGPLTLSLKIDERYEAHDGRDPAFVQSDSHWQEGVDSSLWPCYTIHPAGDWNFALDVDAANLPINFNVERKPWPADDFPFTLESTPLVFRASGAKVPSWGMDATGMTDNLPDESAPREKVSQPITLVPMGAARLRISAFPRNPQK